MAQQAVEAAPDSATAQIALSYAQQARFDLEGARASLEKAVQLDPQNALAWARLAELQSSFGELEKALKAAQTGGGPGAQSRPHPDRSGVRLPDAGEDDNRPGRPLKKPLRWIRLIPSRGWGWGWPRSGRAIWHEGSRDIEIAASLDPNNALIRSYLGKAYYEEKRTELDEREYAVAKELDPKDPTPWFYDAIAKQTTNRPVEALQDLQKAIELNDNRAVYRSRLLLDADLAARSASLGRIYSDLGFQQLALVEGWKSVNTDPTQLFRPPVSGRFVLRFCPATRSPGSVNCSSRSCCSPSTSRPFSPAWPRATCSSSAPAVLGRSPSTSSIPCSTGIGLPCRPAALPVKMTPVLEKVSSLASTRSLPSALGGFHFETDGFRNNADQKDDIANAFLQAELSPKTSIQAEYRYRNTERGDLQQRFFPEDFFHRHQHFKQI